MKVEELKNVGLEREYKVHVPSNAITLRVEAVIAERAKTFKLAGFREGKVPLSIIKSHIGSDILSSQVGEVVSSSLQQILKENNLKPALPPSIDIQSFDHEGDLVFTIKMTIIPQLPTIDYDKIKIESIEIKLSESEIAAAEQSFTQMIRSFEKTKPEYAALKDDILIIDFSGTADGKDFTKGLQQNVKVHLGSGAFIPEIEAKLIGMRVKDETEVVVTLPQDYEDAELAGKEAKFNIIVNEIHQAGPEVILDDELAMKVGLKDISELKEVIKRRVTSELSMLSRMRDKKRFFDKLDEICDFDLPSALIEADVKSIIDDARQNAEKEGTLAEFEADKTVNDRFAEIAKRRVKLGLMLADIAQKNEITVNDADLQQAVNSQIAAMPSKKKQILDFFSSSENMDKLKGPILEEKTVDFLFGKIHMSKIPVSAEEFSTKYMEDIQQELQQR